MAAVCELCLGIIARHPGIAPQGVVAHSDIAPDRKQDPGEFFDWEGLAANGVGLWPRGVPGGNPSRPEGAEAEAATLLAGIGYRAGLPLPVLLTAFQRRFRPERVDGIADAGTLARLRAVAELMESG
jgi:N-acetylmuramoyl-L-alanine amidase